MKKNDVKKSLRLYISIKEYLENHLMSQKGASPQTIRSYRDSLNIYLEYLKSRNSCGLADLSFESMPLGEMHKFFEYIEKERGCGVSTRNQRLSAIRSFYRFAARRDNSLMAYYLELMEIPVKKTPAKNAIEFFSEKNLETILRQPDIETRTGYRDLVFMIVLYDTGGRANEIISLTPGDLHLLKDSDGLHLTLHGKGRKIRKVPIMQKTSDHLSAYIKRFHPGKYDSDTPLFYVHHRTGNTPLSEDAVEAFIKKYAKKACTEDPTFPNHCYPHMWRHSRAMHLYRNGMPLHLVSQWLGHSKMDTTVQFYADADLEMKREAIESATSDIDELIGKRADLDWENDEELLKLLYCLK